MVDPRKVLITELRSSSKFFVLKVASDFDFSQFLKKDSSATWFQYSQGKNFQLSKLSMDPLCLKYV